jgi:YbbR domain-containing protein
MIDFLRRHVLPNLGLKIFSLLFAVGLWLVVAHDPPAEIALNVPIEFHNIPDRLEINSENIPAAQVRVRGPQRLITQLRPYDVHVQVDLTDAKPGERTYDLSARQIREPRDVEVIQVVPSQLHLAFDSRLTRQLEVRPRVTGTFASGLRMLSVIADPATVTVSGPRARVEAVQSATTDPVDASGVVGSQTFSTSVYVADPLIQVVHPVPVHVTVIMEKTSGAAGRD